jgi:hypothetical protein
MVILTTAGKTALSKAMTRAGLWSLALGTSDTAESADDTALGAQTAQEDLHITSGVAITDTVPGWWMIGPTNPLVNQGSQIVLKEWGLFRTQGDVPELVVRHVFVDPTSFTVETNDTITGAFGIYWMVP